MNFDNTTIAYDPNILQRNSLSKSKDTVTHANITGEENLKNERRKKKQRQQLKEVLKIVSNLILFIFSVLLALCGLSTMIWYVLDGDSPITMRLLSLTTIMLTITIVGVIIKAWGDTEYE